MPPDDNETETKRRTLRFYKLDEALTEADRLGAAERQGQLRQFGNWSLGQALGHLSTWAGFAYEPSPVKFSWPVKLMARWMIGKRKFLYSPMRAGARLPKVPGGTVGTDRLPLDEGLARLHRTFERLQHDEPTAENALFGPLTREEWTAVNLRHAELHLSFFDTD